MGLRLLLSWVNTAKQHCTQPFTQPSTQPSTQQKRKWFILIRTTLA
jgi:hypothetical protein